MNLEIITLSFLVQKPETWFPHLQSSSLTTHIFIKGRTENYSHGDKQGITDT